VQRLEVDPLHVIDDAQQSTLRGCPGHQAKGGQANEKIICWSRTHHSERGTERITLGPWQFIETINGRQQETVKRSECKGAFCLDARDPKDRHTLCGGGRVVEQCRLSHSGLALDHNGSAHSSSGRPNHLIQLSALAVAVEQHAGLSGIHVCRSGS
jgi:hypothetical protein